MPDFSDESVARDRERIGEALQGVEVDGDTKELTGALVVGWYVVSEWVDTTGERWLCRIGSEGATSWQIKGWLHDALDDLAVKNDAP